MPQLVVTSVEIRRTNLGTLRGKNRLALGRSKRQTCVSWMRHFLESHKKDNYVDTLLIVILLLLLLGGGGGIYWGMGAGWGIGPIGLIVLVLVVVFLLGNRRRRL
jgi:hypothetical protein